MQVQPQFLGSYPSAIPRSMSSHPHLTTSISETQWHQSSDSSSATASQIYSMLNQSPALIDYSPSRGSSDSSFGNYNAGHLPSVQSGNAGEYLDYSPQVDSSTGPSRGIATRRKARTQANQQMPIGRGNREPQTHTNLSLMYNVQSSPASRPQTPGSFSEANHFPSQPSHLNIMHTHNAFHPVLDATAQGQSYDQWGQAPPSQSRSRSTSTSDVRSVSPAGSSGTTISSSHSGQQSHSSFPRSRESPSDEPRTKGRKMRLCNGDRKRMCQMHLDNPEWKQEQLAKMFDVERSTVSKILKNKDSWLTVKDVNSHRVAKHRPSKFPDIEKALVQKLWATSRDGTILSDSLIRALAKEVAAEQAVVPERFKASSGWVDNFKSRAAIRRGVMTKGLEGLLDEDSSDAEGPLVVPATFAMGDAESEDSPEPPAVPTSHQSFTRQNAVPSVLFHVVENENAPTLAQAEQAVGVLRDFLHVQHEDFITETERNSLQHISCLLVRASQGLPYERDY